MNLFIMDLSFKGPIEVYLECVLLHVALILGELPMGLIQIINSVGITFFNLKASFNIVMQKVTIIIKQPPFILEHCLVHQEKSAMPINSGIKHATAHHEKMLMIN